MPWVLSFVPPELLDQLQRKGIDVVRGASDIAGLADYVRDASGNAEWAAVYSEVNIVAEIIAPSVRDFEEIGD